MLVTLARFAFCMIKAIHIPFVKSLMQLHLIDVRLFSNIVSFVGIILSCAKFCRLVTCTNSMNTALMNALNNKNQQWSTYPYFRAKSADNGILPKCGATAYSWWCFITRRAGSKGQYITLILLLPLHVLLPNPDKPDVDQRPQCNVNYTPPLG